MWVLFIISALHGGDTRTDVAYFHREHMCEIAIPDIVETAQIITGAATIGDCEYIETGVRG